MLPEAFALVPKPFILINQVVFNKTWKNITASIVTYVAYHKIALD